MSLFYNLPECFKDALTYLQMNDIDKLNQFIIQLVHTLHEAGASDTDIFNLLEVNVLYGNNHIHQDKKDNASQFIQAVLQEPAIMPCTRYFEAVTASSCSTCNILYGKQKLLVLYSLKRKDNYEFLKSEAKTLAIDFDEIFTYQYEVSESLSYMDEVQYIPLFHLLFHNRTIKELEQAVKNYQPFVKEIIKQQYILFKSQAENYKFIRDDIRNTLRFLYECCTSRPSENSNIKSGGPDIKPAATDTNNSSKNNACNSNFSSSDALPAEQQETPTNTAIEQPEINNKPQKVIDEPNHDQKWETLSLEEQAKQIRKSMNAKELQTPVEYQKKSCKKQTINSKTTEYKDTSRNDECDTAGNTRQNKAPSEHVPAWDYLLNDEMIQDNIEQEKREAEEYEKMQSIYNDVVPDAKASSLLSHPNDNNDEQDAEPEEVVSTENINTEESNPSGHFVETSEGIPETTDISKIQTVTPAVNDLQVRKIQCENTPLFLHTLEFEIINSGYLCIEHIESKKTNGWLLYLPSCHTMLTVENTDYNIINLIIRFINRKRFPVLCMEPHPLIYSFSSIGAKPRRILSLHTMYGVLMHGQPCLTTTEFFSKQGIPAATSTLFLDTMPHYVSIYKKLYKKILESGLVSQWKRMIHMDTLLGYSYKISNYVVSDTPLFKQDTYGKYEFLCRKGPKKIKKGYYIYMQVTPGNVKMSGKNIDEYIINALIEYCDSGKFRKNPFHVIFIRNRQLYIHADQNVYNTLSNDIYEHLIRSIRKQTGTYITVSLKTDKQEPAER